ncbi:exodeoxyribonuclease VII small subunit [Xanthobacter sp. AM11]|uniref:exodeoxyribonuclease VII small subunit n=1 Tax=Xanthobacter sp. AM11 TaxID=3380643 RepID=UPI0039BF133E
MAEATGSGGAGKAKGAAAAAAGVEKLSFEEALAELEAIVSSLEKGNVPLAESIAIYERGEALKARCEALLKAAEARVETITRDADGRPVGTRPLDPEG